MERTSTTNNDSDQKPSQTNASHVRQHVHSNKTTWDDDIFRLRTVQECEQIFNDYCEARLVQLRNSADELSVLRSCCELLSRLNGTIHNEFAGRVLIFLAKFLPFFHRSGLNLKNESATYELPESVKEHLKSLDERNQAKLKSISQVTGQDIEEGETISDDDEPNEDGVALPPVNDLAIPEKLYERFWRLQDLMNKPDSLFNANTWRSFRGMTDPLLGYFETNPAQYKIWKLDGHYMTSPKTLNLQINDVNMRRCVLLQILLTLEYIDSRVESRPETLRLDNDQFKWIRSCTARILELLEVLPNKKEGYPFMVLVNTVLKNETFWTRWKNEKCPEARLVVAKDDDELIPMGGTYHKRRKISDELRSAKPYNMHVIGSPDVSRLWNRRPQPIVDAPDISKYFNQPVEKQSESFKDPQTSFRILRLLRKSPHFFVPAASMIQSLDGYLKVIAEKHYNNSNNNVQQ